MRPIQPAPETPDAAQPTTNALSLKPVLAGLAIIAAALGLASAGVLQPATSSTRATAAAWALPSDCRVAHDADGRPITALVRFDRTTGTLTLNGQPADRVEPALQAMAAAVYGHTRAVVQVDLRAIPNDVGFSPLDGRGAFLKRGWLTDAGRGGVYMPIEDARPYLAACRP
jgi:hypothetical protein